MPRIGEPTFDVVVVRATLGRRALRAEPASEMATIARSLPHWAATAFCRGFNQAELAQPYGVWAVARRSDSPAADNEVADLALHHAQAVRGAHDPAHALPIAPFVRLRPRSLNGRAFARVQSAE